MERDRTGCSGHEGVPDTGGIEGEDGVGVVSCLEDLAGSDPLGRRTFGIGGRERDEPVPQARRLQPAARDAGQGTVIVRGLKGSQVLHLVDGMRLAGTFDVRDGDVEERRSGASHESAVDKMGEHTGVGVLLGAVTTAATFYAFLVTEFKGLWELGLLTGTGILLLVTLVSRIVGLLVAQRSDQATVEKLGALEAKVDELGRRLASERLVDDQPKTPADTAPARPDQDPPASPP